ncbi:MAG: hypothetical protein F4164_10710 [Gemmatimonadales bacterium]|nr:hypothetical protein [Gemmatimonadales bacterium]MYG49815.1 hypothetical protein [Gemmatimonadales bacterium]MYK02423.1 hypothetical protein [Candidatus Palauibacter ramosifaciens]
MRLRAAALPFVSLVWAASVTAQANELGLVEDLRLGTADGMGPDVFGDIHDVAVDSFGRIYVLDAGWKEVRLFDGEGGFIRRLAPEGDGPGERRHRTQFPARMTWDERRGLLWVDDSVLRSVLDSVGAEHARSTKVLSLLRNPTQPITVVMAVDRQGRVYEQQYRVFGDSTYSYVARGGITQDHELSGDTLRIDARAMATEGTRRTVETASASTRGTMTLTMSRPTRAQIAWTASPDGTVWLADHDRRRLHELTISGDTIRTVDIPLGPPEELDVSPEGWIWVRRTTDTNQSAWDVLDNCGVYVGSTSVSYPVTVTEVGSAGIIHVVGSDRLDIEYVVRLRLDTGVSRRSC